ncbi:competence/damage-inducible protein A [Parasporobacterium paucivorans]|uniref:Putative competence-damage inducible protein n=1 Tax=Parasporobacterium paucivorans DSM 15970 TaxID=1122934 RepID=A0A1M6F9A6_9FIRM|nr:competence/damage-inducible protein A [Parasporobacterium paucivorans]SHI94262.1 competence/damage-inducible protein cinA [Parasporobacterium paucivorans DSM 15970]
MTAELISVGTELLLGNIVNTNARYLATQCAELGFSAFNQTVVGDNEPRLADALQTALERSDIVILTGGLGPTRDDLTKETTAGLLKRNLVRDERSFQRIKSYFSGRNIKDIACNNYKQADIIEGSIVLDNDDGTAPGLIVEHEGKIIILLPGPPKEMTEMFRNKAYPYLVGKTDGTIFSSVIRLIGIGESKVAEMVDDLINGKNPTMATYAKEGEVMLRLTAKATTREDAMDMLKPLQEETRKRFTGYILTENPDESLEEIVVGLLKKAGLSLSSAESCTGGLLAGRIINVSGVSEIFKEGFVTYSNEAKVKRLGVPTATLEEFGAVSVETAKAMAQGCARATGTDVAIATTGIAGPDGGTIHKPVGLVYIACSFGGNTVVEEYFFKGSRDRVREQTIIRALDLIRKILG